MRSNETIDQHPEFRKQRFPRYLWPQSENPKDVDESWILIYFAHSAGLHLDSAPVKQPPPMPDLQCVIAGRPVLFELAEILESDLAEGVAYSGKQSHKKAEALSRGDTETASSIQTDGRRSFPANASLKRILWQKLAKTYETNGLEAQLLLFYDCQRPWGPFYYISHLHYSLQRELADLIASSVFQRVWIFHLPTETVMGYLEVDRSGVLRHVFDWKLHFDFCSPFEALVPGCGERPDEVRSFVPVKRHWWQRILRP
jgi:hypothetical protein